MNARFPDILLVELRMEGKPNSLRKSTMRLFLSLSICTIIANSSLGGDQLSVGSPSPVFEIGKVLRGVPLAQLPQQKFSVVEFSGTTCVPCIKFIPEMNKLQTRYPDVLFVSVFCESEESVARFLAGAGKNISVTVALDSSHHMRTHWLEASGLPGIPLAFVIDRAGKIAWLGHPDDDGLRDVLSEILAGTFDPRFHTTRLALQRRLAEENQKSFQRIEKTNEISRQAYVSKTPAEAIALIDQALLEFKGSPEAIILSTLKLSFLGTLPNSSDTAYEHAMSLAVAALNTENPFYYLAACEEMLAHYEFALDENKNGRLVDLALLLLTHEDARQHHITLHSEQELDFEVRYQATLANAYRLRGELQRGIENLEKAVALLKESDSDKKPDWWVKQQQQTLTMMETRLLKWKSQKLP